MSYAMLYDVPADAAMYRQVNAAIGDEKPKGLVVHLVLQADTGADLGSPAKGTRHGHFDGGPAGARELPPGDGGGPWRAAIRSARLVCQSLVHKPDRTGTTEVVTAEFARPRGKLLRMQEVEQ